jgi:hypothetical protein
MELQNEACLPQYSRGPHQQLQPIKPSKEAKPRTRLSLTYKFWEQGSKPAALIRSRFEDSTDLNAPKPASNSLSLARVCKEPE